jgi:hypothetical protein
MGTIENFNNLKLFSWKLDCLINSLEGMQSKEVLEILSQLSSDIDQFILSAKPEDNDYLKENETRIILFKSFVNNAIRCIPLKTIENINPPAELHPYLNLLLASIH